MSPTLGLCSLGCVPTILRLCEIPNPLPRLGLFMLALAFPFPISQHWQPGMTFPALCHPTLLTEPPNFSFLNPRKGLDCTRNVALVLLPVPAFFSLCFPALPAETSGKINLPEVQVPAQPLP